MSYSRADREYVDGLVEQLTEAGVELWIDRTHILPSAEWMPEIEDGIRRSDCLLFVLSPDSVASPICLAELQHAVAASKRIVPIAHRPVPSGDVPEAVGTVQWINGIDVDGIVRGLRTDPERVRLHTRLFTRAWEWRARGRRRGNLLRGSDLAEATRWLDSGSTDPAPTDPHREFVVASRIATRWRRLAALGATVVIAVAGVVGVVVGTDSAAAARSRDLAGRAAALAGLRADSAMWLGRAALAESPTPQARETLISALRTQPRLTRYLPPPAELPSLSGDPVRRRMARSPDGSRLAVSRAGGSVDILTGDGITTLARVEVGWLVDGLAFAPDGRTLAVADVGYTAEQLVALIDVGSGKVTEELAVPRDPAAAIPNDFLVMITPPPLMITADGLLVVAGTDLALHGYDLTARRWIFTATGHRNRPTALAASSDGRLLYSASLGGDVLVHDRAGHELGRLVPFDGTSAVVRTVWSLAVDPVGGTVVAGTSEGTVLSWTRTPDPPTRQPGRGTRST